MTDDSDFTCRNRDIPRDVADQFRVSLGLDTAPETLDEWVAETVRTFGTELVPDRPDALCTTDSSRHEARFDDTARNFRCFFDLLLLPFVLEDSTAVRVRSRSPISTTVVSGRLTREGISFDPDAAVMSFGAATDVVSAEYLDVPASLAYHRFCPFINAFPDESEYERWALENETGVTMPLALSDGFAVARRLAEAETE